MWPFRKKTAQESELPTIVMDPLWGDPQAARLADALTRMHWPTVHEVLVTAPSNEHRIFYVWQIADVEGVEEWIQGPVRDDRSSVWPLVCQGARAISWAWEARGTGLAKTVTEEGWKLFRRRLKLAEDSFDEALERNPSCVEAWHYLILLGRARQQSTEERWHRFNALTALDPTHLQGHEQMLEALKPKWSGSWEEMFAFARERSQPGTGLPSLIVECHIEKRTWTDDDEPEYMEQPEVGKELVAAAHQSIWHPDYRESFYTPVLYNSFAMAFSLADQFAEAERCFQWIGEDRARRGPWSGSWRNPEQGFIKMRSYVRSKL